MDRLLVAKIMSLPVGRPCCSYNWGVVPALRRGRERGKNEIS